MILKEWFTQVFVPWVLVHDDNIVMHSDEGGALFEEDHEGAKEEYTLEINGEQKTHTLENWFDVCLFELIKKETNFTNDNCDGSYFGIVNIYPHNKTIEIDYEAHVESVITVPHRLVDGEVRLRLLQELVRLDDKESSVNIDRRLHPGASTLAKDYLINSITLIKEVMEVKGVTNISQSFSGASDNRYIDPPECDVDMSGIAGLTYVKRDVSIGIEGQTGFDVPYIYQERMSFMSVISMLSEDVINTSGVNWHSDDGGGSGKIIYTLCNGQLTLALQMEEYTKMTTYFRWGFDEIHSSL